MTTFGYVAVGAALSQAALTALLLLQGGMRGLSRKLYGLLLFAAFGYLLLPLFPDSDHRWILMAISTLVPGAFWLFSASLFDDHYDLPLWHPLLVAFTVVMPTVHGLLSRFGIELPAGVFVDLPQFLEFVILALALYTIFAHWRDDLVVARRYLRLWFCSITGAFIFTLILSREVLFSGAAWLESAQYVATAVMMIGTNALLVRFTPGLLDPIRRMRPAGAEPDDTAETAIELLEPINALIVERGIYREPGMTIGKLAELLDMPEYRLRRLINSGLGYRNFNDFLNSFRIRDAARRLADPDEVKVPVLTIAMDSGFRSISSFNKAFKTTHTVTPTVFRRQQLGGEAQDPCK